LRALTGGASSTTSATPSAWTVEENGVDMAA
jgi:hypothetical protein